MNAKPTLAGKGAFCAASILFVALALPLHACAQKTDRPTVGTMTTAPAKKNGSGVVVQYRVDGSQQPNGTAVVTITLNGVTAATGASVRFVADSGLRLGNSPPSLDLKAGEPTTVTVDVVPGANVGYLHVFTTHNGAESVTSIPVGIAPAATKSSTELKQGADGEKIISYPVK